MKKKYLKVHPEVKPPELSKPETYNPLPSLDRILDYIEEFKPPTLHKGLLEETFNIPEKDFNHWYIKKRYLDPYRKTGNLEQKKNLAAKLFKFYSHPDNRVKLARLRKGTMRFQ